MEKTKIFISENQKWQPLNDYISRIESFLDTSPGLVIENCKSILESILKTILVEVAGKTDEDLKKCGTTNLYGQVRDLIFIEKKGYCNIIGSFSSAISEYRNKLGEISHGKDIHTLENNRNELLKDEIEFLLSTTDNITFFILSYYKNLYPLYAEKIREINFEDNQEFNDWFDEVEEILNVGGVSLLPSRVLFDGDIEAYKTSLAEHASKSDLIERLRISPNFASTHSLIGQLSQIQNFSKDQIRKIFEAFVFNSQINWIVADPDVESFYKPLIGENRELLTAEEIALFEYSYANLM